jgi:signal transduction histidine kinase
LRRRLPVERRGEVRMADWVALQVSDTGAGIAPDHRERIFDEFEQLGPRTGDSAVRGTGLGLAISRRLAHLLDGELTVDSVLGEGSTFTLWLPVDPADVRPAQNGDRRLGDRRRQDRRGGGDAADAAPGAVSPFGTAP